MFTLVTVLSSLVAAEQASITIHSFSPQVDRGIAETDFGFEYEMDLTSDRAMVPGNGEMPLAPTDVPFTHAGYFILWDPFAIEPAVVAYVQDIPLLEDKNTNGEIDFYEVEIGLVDEPGGGFYRSPLDGQPKEFTSLWNRAAGESGGNVLFHLPEFGLFFKHTFRILIYSGTIQYEREETSIRGEVLLTNVHEPTDTLSGPLVLSVLSEHEISGAMGTWTNFLNQEIGHEILNPMERQGLSFLSALLLKDGYFATWEEDYKEWFVRITSPDLDGNQVPDLVQTKTDPFGPKLEIMQVAEGIQIQLTGISGRQYEIQAAPDLSAAAEWGLLRSFTLSGNSHSFVIPADAPARFFRAKAL